MASNPLQDAANRAASTLPYSIASKRLPIRVQAGSGARSYNTGRPSIASVDPDNPNSGITVEDQHAWTNPDYTPQLLRHEMSHEVQKNWAPSILKSLPPVNPNAPYDYGGAVGLKKIGGDPTKLSVEQSAAVQQEMQAMRQNGQKIDPIYNTFDRKFGEVPLSVMQPTDPNQKGINTMPRVPGLPADPVWGMKKLYAKKVLPVPKGSGSPPQTLPANFTGWDKPSVPETLPANFTGWDTPVNDGGVSARPSVPAAPLPAGLQPDSTTEKVLNGIGDVGVGALKGGLHTVSKSDDWAREHLPAFMTNSDMGFGAPADLTHVKQMATPHNTAQKIGSGVEQAGEFLLPGAAEERAMTKLVPSVGRAAPLLKAGLAAAGSGIVNKAQGGDFLTGALAGGVGGAIGEGLRAVAPRIAESALNIRKLDRAYGKSGGTIGRAVLDETTGLSPSSVAESAQGRLSELNPQLEAAADRASARPNRLRGLLPGPAQEIPLPTSPDVPGTLSRNIRLYQPDAGARLGLPAPGVETPMSSYPDIFPDQLPNARIDSPFEGRGATGTGFREYAGQVPGERGGAGQPQGVLIRPFTARGGAVPKTLSNNSVSLGRARGVLSKAMNTATRQGERTTSAQLQPMMTHLNEDISGNLIPDNITPRQLLDLKRGFGNEFIHRWNPETMKGVKGIAAQTYHAMGDDFNRVVPGAEELNGRISRLIPIAKRAESEELNAPTTQRLFQRIAAPTGALTGTIGGGAYGYEHGGAEGAAKGAAAGLMLPLLLTTPTGEMMMARGINGLSRTLTRLGTGGLLQLDRK